MYQIENKSDIFVEHYVGRFRPTYKIDRIGTEKNLIVYLANGFKSFSYYDDYDNWSDYGYMGYGNPRFAEHFFDGYGRDINGYAYKKDAWTYYCQHIRGKEDVGKKDYSYWRRNKVYKGTFRRTPVEGISKWRGGPSVRPRRIKHLKAMYANPEYKEFNRGSHKDVPDGWWDDWYRCREKNWKSQSKRRHQWKGDVSM